MTDLKKDLDGYVTVTVYGNPDIGFTTTELRAGKVYSEMECDTKSEALDEANSIKDAWEERVARSKRYEEARSARTAREQEGRDHKNEWR